MVGALLLELFGDLNLFEANMEFESSTREREHYNDVMH